ncbi:hypothetical protein Q7P37_003529 [Cladosporium fusiforme]
MHVVQPSARHTHTIIFLHGRDSEAADFASELFESQASDDRTLPEIFPNAKWVFPATTPLLSERFGVEMSQWFDMWSTENPHERSEKQSLSASVSQIQAVVDGEVAIVGSEQVFLAGISQGCATAIHALLSSQHCLAGFIGLNSWLPRGDTITASQNAGSTPVILQHTLNDDVVDIEYGRQLREGLEGLGMLVEWHEYEDGGHWLNEPKGVDALVAFLQREACM